jgi:hypothetical protein
VCPAGGQVEQNLGREEIREITYFFLIYLRWKQAISGRDARYGANHTRGGGANLFAKDSGILDLN